MSKRVILALVLAAAALSLEACGRKGDPLAPEGSAYPRTYPSGAPERERNVFRDLEGKNY